QRLQRLGEAAEAVDQPADPRERLAAAVGDVAQRLERRPRRERERPEVLDRLVDRRRLGRQARDRPRPLIGQRARALHGGLELLQEGRQLGEVLLQRVALLGGGDRGLAGGVDEAAEVLAVLGQRRQREVGVVDELAEHLVLTREDRLDLVDLLERRV